MKIRPIKGNILSKLIEEPKMTQSGLHIPETALYDSKSNFLARVLAVGPGVTHPKTGQIVPLEVKAGDVLIVKKYEGWRVEVDGEEYAIFNEGHVAGIVERGHVDGIQDALEDFFNYALLDSEEEDTVSLTVERRYYEALRKFLL